MNLRSPSLPLHPSLPEGPPSVPEPSEVVAELRSLLAERFQQAHTAVEPASGRLPLPTGFAHWDALTGGVRPGEITEICGALGATHLVWEGVLERLTQAGRLGAWVDAGDSLEVADWCPRQLQRLLWVRCRDVLTALKAADLLLRDGNCSWVALDLQAAAPRALRGVCGTHWHRFHRLLAQQGSTLLVLSRTPLVEGVRVRVLADESWELNALERPRSELREEAPLQVFVRGRMPEGGRHAAPGFLRSPQRKTA